MGDRLGSHDLPALIGQDGCPHALVLILLLVVPWWGAGTQAQSITYSVSGTLTSVPSSVSRVFSVGGPWAIDVTIDEPAHDESAVDDSSRESEERWTETYVASSFSWVVGSVSGTATGVTRVFVSDDHLSRDGMAWQALSYSAIFSPSSIGDTGIRGIQAGLVDPSGSAFSSTDLPETVVLSQFDHGFFQVFFKTRCEPFGHDSLDGSVTSVVSPQGDGDNRLPVVAPETPPSLSRHLDPAGTALLLATLAAPKSQAVGDKPPDRGGQIVGPCATASGVDEATRARTPHATAVSDIDMPGTSSL